jgi:hypothetical protein
LLAKHDAKGKRFILYSWKDVVRALPCIPDASARP